MASRASDSVSAARVEDGSAIFWWISDLSWRRMRVSRSSSDRRAITRSTAADKLSWGMAGGGVGSEEGGGEWGGVGGGGGGGGRGGGGRVKRGGGGTRGGGGGSGGRG